MILSFRPLGIPHLEKVTLFNINSNRSIDMTSISGSTVHFHSSFFEDKKIPPLGNTSFNVVFLGREEGSVESNLFIQTTEGHIKYQVNVYEMLSSFQTYNERKIIGKRCKYIQSLQIASNCWHKIATEYYIFSINLHVQSKF